MNTWEKKKLTQSLKNKKKFDGKVTELLALDKELWEELKLQRQPYGTVNEMFEDFIRVLLGKKPIHPELLVKLNKVVQELTNN
jgi:hypothetical protein